MNGAIAVPWVKISNVPIKKIVIIKGANQYFLRTLRKSQISFNKSKNTTILKNPS